MSMNCHYKLRTTTKDSKFLVMLISMGLMFLMVAPLQDNIKLINAVSATEQQQQQQQQHNLAELLDTETALIEQLKNYVSSMEQKIETLKSKTTAIKCIHRDASNDTEKYVNNPINAITLLKRFTTDWKQLRAYANKLHQSDFAAQDLAMQMSPLKFPNEDELDDVVVNLLRAQNLNKLEPHSLAAGVIQGVKVGSAMSWSDCLEIGRKSDEFGDYMIAKRWLEIALEKIAMTSNNNNLTTTIAETATNSPNTKGKFEIFKALLSAEYKQGNLQAALKIAKQMFELNPKHVGVVNAIKTINEELRNEERKSKKTEKPKKHSNVNKEKNKQNKSDGQQQLIAELCASSAEFYFNPPIHTCTIENYQLPQLLLQPLQMELLSLDPYIVIYHNVLQQQQIEELKNDVTSEMTKTQHQTWLNYIESNRLKEISKQLQIVTGHSSESFEMWQIKRSNFKAATDVSAAASTLIKSKQTVARVLLNLGEPLLGGSIVFPQLQLNINLPQSSLLYVSNLNELKDLDYRSQFEVCPVIVGSQIVATAAIQHGTIS